MSDDKRARMIARVRRLLAVAENSGATDEERQTFAAAAASLMARYDLTEAIVRAEQNKQPEPVESWNLEVPGTGGFGKARAWALGDIAEAYGCECAYRHNDAGVLPRLVLIVGTASDLAALRILLPPIAAQMEHAALTSVRAHLAKLREWGRWAPAEIRRERSGYINSFLTAYGHGVAEKIRQRRQQITNDLTTSSTGAELVLADRSNRVHAEFRRRFPNLRRARPIGRRSNAGSTDGYAQGLRAHLPGNDLTTDTRKQLPRD